MGRITMKILEKAVSNSNKLKNFDSGNLINLDGMDFFIQTGKVILKAGKEILF